MAKNIMIGLLIFSHVVQ